MEIILSIIIGMNILTCIFNAVISRKTERNGWIHSIVGWSVALIIVIKSL